MEFEKRKRISDSAETEGKRVKPEADGSGNAVKEVAPADEEVEEFFAILRRIQVAVKYFQKRNGGRELRAAPWNPSFEREDFDGVEKTPKKLEENQNVRLDLNSDPASDHELGVSNSV